MNTFCILNQSPLKRIITAFSALIIFCATFSAANPVIKISPDKFTVGISKTLNLECSFNKSDAQAFAKVFSLLLLHAGDNGGHRFAHLVSVNSDGRLETNSSIDNGFTASGSINNDDGGVFFINITWQNPVEDRAGLYKCVASGANSTGMPVSLSSAGNVESTSANVEATSPNIEKAALETNSTRKELDEFKLSVSPPKGNLERPKRSYSINARFARLESQVSLLRSEQDKARSKLERAKNSMFLSSSNYGNRRYWITRYSTFFNPGYAQSTCMTYGGYLAELDTYDEYVFVKNFVTYYGSSNFAVMLGGTDEGHESRWINRHSLTPVASFWASGQPDNYGGKEHCSCLWKKFHFAMNDCPCYFLSNEVAFVCEIPE